MENRTEITLAEQYAAALDWWRDAGVDQDFVDEAQSLLEEPEATRPAPAPSAASQPEASEPAPPKITAADLPENLGDFRKWWTDPASPIPAGPGRRIAPRGEQEAQLMVLVPMPEANDGDSLLQGPQGTLIANIAKAIGIDTNALYLASALPSHMPLPAWEQLHAEGLGTAVRHHIALARPKRVLLFGSKLPALLGHDYGAPPESFASIGDTPALTTFALERLLDHPRQRARLWQRLLQWNSPR